MKQRVTIYKSYSCAVEFEDLVATVGSQPPLGVIEAFIDVLSGHFGNLLIGAMYDEEHEVFLVTLRKFEAALECRDTWETLIEVVSTTDDWQNYERGGA